MACALCISPEFNTLSCCWFTDFMMLQRKLAVQGKCLLDTGSEYGLQLICGEDLK